MAEKVDERRVQFGSSGTASVSIPKSYKDDLGIDKETIMECFREGDTIMFRPKNKEAKSK